MNIVWFVIQIILICAVLLSAWFVGGIISDGIDSKLMTFESEPKEGWDYWRSKYRAEAIKGWAIPAIIVTGVFGWLAVAVCKSLMRINTAINSLYKEDI